jgi:hypothetical protein
VNAPELIVLAQAAAVERWSNDAALLAHLGGPHVFEDRMPEKDPGDPEPTRYIIIGDQTAAPVGVMNSRASSVTMTASSWTRGELDKAAAVETVRLMGIALETPLALTGFGAALLKNISTAVVPTEDPALHHAPTRWRITSFANA